MARAERDGVGHQQSECLVLQTIRADRGGSTPPIRPRFKPSNGLKAREYEVRDISLMKAYELTKQFHYAKGGSNTRTYSHGLFPCSNFMDCVGAAWWLPPTKSAAMANFPEGDWRKVLTLSRLVLVPGLPTNAASFLIAQSIKMIRAIGAWDCLLTYADERMGHTGAIYRATNWDYRGKTKPEDCWIDAQGRMVSRKAGPKTRTREQMKALGYTMAGKFAKHKFRIIL